MKTFSCGDVVLTSFPFTGDDGAKQRPALVLVDTGDNDCILAVITSKIRTSSYDVNLTDWKKAKLLFPSIARIHKIYTKEKSTIIGTLGNITKKDLYDVQRVIKKLFLL
ncbi:MAG: type II toxin-antitoxin system PemK/MazF family toxin [Patescibacteria group bacterium]|jgi:mRNA interferase MazF